MRNYLPITGHLRGSSFLRLHHSTYHRGLVLGCTQNGVLQINLSQTRRYKHFWLGHRCNIFTVQHAASDHRWKKSSVFAVCLFFDIYVAFSNIKLIVIQYCILGISFFSQNDTHGVIKMETRNQKPVKVTAFKADTRNTEDRCGHPWHFYFNSHMADVLGMLRLLTL